MQLAIALAVLAAVPFYQMPQPELETWLDQIHSQHPDFGNRVTVIARAALGTPYHDGPLGEGPEGTHDQDPLIDLTRVDCVTFVEQVLALASSPQYARAFENLQAIRYERGQIGFEARNHFFCADWTPNNSTWVRDVTQELGVETAPLTRTISRRGFFERVQAPEFGQETPDRDVTIHYIPTAATAEAVPHLPDTAVLIFIGKIEWLFALHCGIWAGGGEEEDGGEGQLIHASSKAGEVAAVDLPQYMEENRERYLGFVVLDMEKERQDSEPESNEATAS